MHLTSRREERVGRKLEEKIVRIMRRDFSSINPYKTEMVTRRRYLKGDVLSIQH
jgi:hypothetical protein